MKTKPTTVTTSHASPYFVALCELDLACTYALRSPKLAIECLEVSIGASIRAGRPDLTFRATELLRALGTV